ncbi:hypothetical protein CDD83_6429 [Cordyceps sp. RAO-2017]|nr:hypothetical protein CDD83_6429 [Cordyceps sp. RAO-2017]
MHASWCSGSASPRPRFATDPRCAGCGARRKASPIFALAPREADGRMARRPRHTVISMGRHAASDIIGASKHYASALPTHARHVPPPATTMQVRTDHEHPGRPRPSLFKAHAHKRLSTSRLSACLAAISIAHTSSMAETNETALDQTWLPRQLLACSVLISTSATFDLVAVHRLRTYMVDKHVNRRSQEPSTPCIPTANSDLLGPDQRDTVYTHTRSRVRGPWRTKGSRRHGPWPPTISAQDQTLCSSSKQASSTQLIFTPCLIVQTAP